MQNLYYVDYKLECQDDAVTGGMYVLDTGVGMLELGGFEEDLYYQDIYLDQSSNNIRQWLESASFTEYRYVQVL